MPFNTLEAPFRLGPWTVHLSTGSLTGPGGEVQKLEPKVSDLLKVLIDADGQVVSREHLFQALWPGVIVGEDALTRAVFKLRKALEDDPKSPAFVETVPKRGYRLMVQPATLEPDEPRSHPRWPLAAGVLAIAGMIFFLLPRGGDPMVAVEIERATDRYMVFTQADNEAAIELYQRVLSEPNPHPSAEAGLAAALVQRVIRWPGTIGSDREGTSSVERALELGLTDTPEAREVIARASQLAERSVRREPEDAYAWRVVGLVRTTQRDFEGAFDAYAQGLKRDPDNWGIKINLSELHGMHGDSEKSYTVLSEAYEAMEAAYLVEPQRVGKWRAPIGVMIARADLEAGRLEQAEAWFRRVLRDEPFDENATRELAQLLTATNRADEATSLCTAFESRVGFSARCTERIQ